jgi:hypothetical protein
LSQYRLMNMIGIFIFGGIALLVVLQTDKAEKAIEAGAFAAVMAVIYFVLAAIYEKNRSIFIPVIGVLAVFAVSMIFLQGLFFGTHH